MFFTVSRHVSYIFRLARYFFTDSIAQDLKRDMDVDISRYTVSRRAWEFGIKSCVACKKPFITPTNRRQRVTWCKERIHWTYEQWKNVLWTDESPYVLRWHGHVRVLRRVGERYHPECIRGTIKHDKKIMVWGCFSANGVGSFIRIKGILVKEQYKQILIRQAFPSGVRLLGAGFTFQQDNDPKHTAKIVKQYLLNKENDGTITRLPWPSQSPDLNPIEHLWKVLDDSEKDRKPQNQQQLYEILHSAWLKLPLNTLDSLVRSMPRRLQAVIDAKGYPTKY